jgi:beta-N-acetylhexosaminidase
MSLRDFRHQAGRLAIVGFGGHGVPADLRHLAADFDLGGVIYFARNIVEPVQVRDLSREVRELERHWPFWVSVDQEGGRVARLKHPFTEWPPAVTLGRGGSEDLAGRFADALSRELRAVGIDLDYVPVLDVHTNPANPVIGDRALSDQAAEVARLGEVLIRRLQAGGVAASGKHFPGHGDTSVDSHEALPVVEHERERLAAVEFVPFRRAIEAGVATIMTAHVLVPALDPERPASLSPVVVTDLLKEAMGFAGVVVSDDLGMKAIAARTPLPEAAVAAIEAGCDMVLLCNSTIDEQVSAIEALIGAAESGRLSQARLDDAFARQRETKARVGRPAGLPDAPLDCIGSLAHQAIAQEMAAWL